MRGLTIALAAAAVIGIAASQGQAADGYRLLKLERHHVKWGAPVLGTGATVTYGLITRPTDFPTARNCKGMAPVTRLLSRLQIAQGRFRAEVEAAFALWAQAANINFRPAAPGTAADILIGVQRRPRGYAFTNVDYDAEDERPGSRSIEQSLICVNPERDWKIGFDGDLEIYDLRFTLAHEIGHAIGLDHAMAENQLMGFRYHERFRAPQAGDISGAVDLYGQRLMVDRGAPRPAAEHPQRQDSAAEMLDETPQLSLGVEGPGLFGAPKAAPFTGP